MAAMVKSQTAVAVPVDQMAAELAESQVAVVEADKQKRSVAATTGPLWSSHYLTMMFPQ